MQRLLRCTEKKMKCTQNAVRAWETRAEMGLAFDSPLASALLHALQCTGVGCGEEESFKSLAALFETRFKPRSCACSASKASCVRAAAGAVRSSSPASASRASHSIP